MTKDRVLYVICWLGTVLAFVYGLVLVNTYGINSIGGGLVGLAFCGFAGWLAGSLIDLFRFVWHGRL